MKARSRKLKIRAYHRLLRQETREFPLDFETVLGFYSADERRITRFPQGIEYVAKEVGVDPFLIERLVRDHECAHALHHVGMGGVGMLPEEVIKRFGSNDSSYRACPDESKEQIAQLATLVTIRVRRDARAGDLQRLKNKLSLLLEMSDERVFPTARHIESILS